MRAAGHHLGAAYRIAAQWLIRALPAATRRWGARAPMGRRGSADRAKPVKSRCGARWPACRDAGQLADRLPQLFLGYAADRRDARELCLIQPPSLRHGLPGFLRHRRHRGRSQLQRRMGLRETHAHHSGCGGARLLRGEPASELCQRAPRQAQAHRADRQFSEYREGQLVQARRSPAAHQ